MIIKKIETYVSMGNLGLSSRKSSLVFGEVGFSLGNNHVFVKKEFLFLKQLKAFSPGEQSCPWGEGI
jgi:hypothetical protein